MAHELEIVNGNAQMMYVGETPWHGLGTKLDAPPTIEEALVASGLNWNVNALPLFAEVPVGDHTSRTIKVAVPGKAIVRDTDNTVLGRVGDDYTPVQNREAFGFFDEAIAEGLVSLETAGSLRGGTRIWVMAHINDTTVDVVRNDPVKAYFLLSNSFDGTLAVKVGFTGVRVVCQNTLTLAHHNDRSHLVKVRHTKNVGRALEQLKEVVNWQKDAFLATVDQFRALANTGCDEETLRKYVTKVFEPELKVRNQNKDEEKAETSAEKSVDKLLAKIIPLFESGKGNDRPGVRGTLWAGYNAVTEYQTWERGRENDTRLDSLWFGLNGKTNARAFDVALKMAA